MGFTVLAVRQISRCWRSGLVFLLAVGMAVSCHENAPAPPPDQAPATTDSPRSPFPTLPAGVILQTSHRATRAEREAIENKLKGTINDLTNSHLVVHGSPIQVNIIHAEDALAASAIHESLLAIKPAPFCLRDGLTIVEYVGQQVDEPLAIKTSYELGYLPKPKRIRYRITAQLATIDTADYMACNRLSNQFLTANAAPKGSTSKEIGELAARFTFSKSLALRSPTLAPTLSNYQFEPTDDNRTLDAARVVVTFPGTSVRHGVPFVTTTAEVTVEDTGLSQPGVTPGPELTSPTSAWPSQSVDIRSLAHQITRGSSTNVGKAQAILDWLTPGKNIHYSGQIGSRWGTLKVIHQKFGHCWDFSDCFVTLCRAAGVPSRQVAGWLYGSSGHVWAEYYTDDNRWQQVDPTGGGPVECGIYHIPLFATEDGEMPIVYLAMPTIKVIADR